MKSLVDYHIEHIPHWKEEISLLRSIAIQTKCDETIKWGDICYMYNQKNVFIISPFKHYVSINFFSGILLKDPYKILKSHGNHQQSARYLEFTSLDDIKHHEKIILEYMQESIDNILLNKQVIKVQKTLDLCEWVIEYFERDERLKNAFNALTPGRQRAYAIHFCQPKSKDASIRRMEKYRDHILQGMGMLDT
jgi:uncharacterized protein YdeI (YjbR/CyaY-like superfamily)